MFRFCVVCLFFLVGCQSPDPQQLVWRESNGKLKVLTTTAMIHDLSREIGGKHVDSLPLIGGDLDPHSYELVKGDDEKFAWADLIFYNGLGLEHGLSLRQNIKGNPKAIGVAGTLLESNPELVLVCDGQYDPHIWMDVDLWMRTIDPIVAALCERDPEHALDYRQNGERLRQQMKEADEQLFATMQSIPKEKRFLVTSHDAFNYFARHYLAEPGEEEWKQRCQAPEGLAPEAQLGVADIIAIISHIETFNVRVLFPESNVSQDSLRKILSAARDKGIDLRLCQEMLYGDAMGDAGSYLEMITHNINVIANELNQ